MKTLVALFALSCTFPVVHADDGITTTFLSEGMTRKVGGYRPIRADMTEDASLVKKAPDGLVSPRYGKLELGGKNFAFILDDQAGADAKWYVDGNGDGDLTNDEAAEWKFLEQDNRYDGSARVQLQDDQSGLIKAYRFDPNDARRAALKSTILYYTDFGYECTITVDGKAFKSGVAGDLSSAKSFWLDRDGNGQTSRNFEMAVVGKPFNFTGTTYEIQNAGGKLSLVKAEKEMPVQPLPPNLEVGQPALNFEAKTMEGTVVSFPKSYAGKVVMLDCWATWCGPCIGEIPHMKKAYDEHHEAGFEILGVSFDSDGMEEKVKEFLTEKEISWSQIYEGAGWDTSIGRMHDVSGIPFVLLVDGDSGKILATEESLRGPKLTEVIAEFLAKKKGQP